MHGTLAILHVLLLGAAAIAEALGTPGGRPAARRWARGLLAAGVVAALLTAFTGLDARKSLPGEGNPAMAGVDHHVLWAIVLLVPVVGATVLRLRMSERDLKRRPWLAPVLVGVAMIFAATILWMGAHIR